MLKTKTNLSVFLAALLAASPALASNDDAKALFAKAEQAYSERADLAKIDQAISLLEQAEKAATDDELKYNIVTLASQAFYYKGNNIDGKNEKLAEYDKGMAKAKAAQGLNEELAEGFYYYAANLGAWAVANGVEASLFRAGELIQNNDQAMAKETRDGEAGVSIDSYGPLRIGGRLQQLLPTGNRAMAVKLLRDANRLSGGEHSLNILYLGEALWGKPSNDGSAAEKAEAKTLFRDTLARGLDSFREDRGPETKKELGDIRKKLASWGN